MASSVQICNIALGTYLGKGRITALTEGTAQAEQCALHYDDARREILSEWPWSFATRRQALARLAYNDRPEWASKFARPANLLRLNWVNDPEEAKQAILCREAFDTPRDVTDSHIYSDLPAATAEFIFDQEDPTVYPPKVTQALAALLAARMAVALTETAAKFQTAMNAYAIHLDEAKVQDIQTERPITVRRVRDYTEAR